MNWVRIHPLIVNWPGGGSPPVFNLSADENGSAVVELAWDPQTLLAPGTYTPNPLRYYSTDVPFIETIPDSRGTNRQVSIPAQTINLTNNQAVWVMPQALWNAYMEESLKTLNNGSGPSTTFSRNIYYRVRITPAGSSTAKAWPPDSALSGPGAQAAPLIGILAMSASLASQVVPDQAAVQAMGGIPGLLPNLWGDLLLGLWRSLPESSPERQGLLRMFAHEAFHSANVQTRGQLLKLWLFAGPSARGRLVELLNRRVVTGSNVTQPAITKTDYRGGRTLVENLLRLLDIVPHPDIPALRQRDQLLDDVIKEILDPNGQVNQGEAGTCATTSIQTFLIMVNPAEYARLQLGLLSATGQVTYADGTTVSVPPAIFQINTRYPIAQVQPFLVRNVSELAFQATLLKVGLGTSFPTYNPSAPPNSANGVNTVFQATIARGLTQDQTSRALRALFNVNFSATSVSPSGDASWPTYPTIQTRQPGVRDALRTALPQAKQPLIVGMYWGGLPSPPNFTAGGHALLALRTESGRVFFKNPQYAGSSPITGMLAGGNATNPPPRRYVDPAQSLESMTDADLAAWILFFYVPDTAII